MSLPYQRIKHKNLSPGEPSGEPKWGEYPISPPGQDDLCEIFRKMLDVGSSEYEHELAHFLHHGYPDTKTDYEQPDYDAKVARYEEKQRKEKERRIRIADKLKTLQVTKKEDIKICIKNEDFKFSCYTPSCGFASNDREEYERHGVLKHPGRPCYPGKADLGYYHWKAQGKKWEI